MKCLLFSLVGDVTAYGYYAGGARLEYGERQNEERLFAFSKAQGKMPETGGEI
jgi:hypothetical protein